MQKNQIIHHVCFFKNDNNIYLLVKSLTDKIMSELCIHKYASARNIYLNIVEKMMLFQKSKFQVHGDDKLKMLMKYLNESLPELYDLSPTCKDPEPKLLLKLFYILMDFISVYTQTPEGIFFFEN